MAYSDYDSSDAESKPRGAYVRDLAVLCLGIAMTVVGASLLLYAVNDGKMSQDNATPKSAFLADAREGSPLLSRDALSDHAAVGSLYGEFVSKLRVVPWGVLGTQLAAGRVMKSKAAAPDASTAIVDPAGLPYITKYGPSLAGGASGALYKFLGIASDDAFPADVTAAMSEELTAKFHAYGNKKVIHAIGPDLRQEKYVGGKRNTVVAALATVYYNILTEFVGSDLPRLRLLPVSGGIFSGEYGSDLPVLTAEALSAAFTKLSATSRLQVMKATSVELCIFLEKDYQRFKDAIP